MDTKNKNAITKCDTKKERSEQYGCMYCEQLILIYKDDLCESCYEWYESVKPYCT